MNNFSTYLSFLICLFFSIIVHSDEFYLMHGDEVELDVLYRDGHSEKTHAIFI